MNKREVFASLIDDRKAAVLKVVINSKEELCLKEIAQKSSVPLSSAHRILQELCHLKILSRREWKNSRVYSCPENEKILFLKDLLTEEYDGVQVFFDAVKEVPGIQTVILPGVRKKGKANILLIGKDIDNQKVEDACHKVRQNGFELSYLTLTKEQYAQMVEMGLYSGEKTVLKG